MKKWGATVCDLDECFDVFFEGTYDDFMDYIDSNFWDIEDEWEIE